MGDSESSSGGLVGSVRRLGDSVLGLLHTRIELAALELQEEKLRILDLCLRGAFFVILAVLTLISATALAALFFWEYSPVLTMAAITAAYGLGAFFLWLNVKKRLQTAPPPFASTVAELKKDAQFLQGKR